MIFPNSLLCLNIFILNDKNTTFAAEEKYLPSDKHNLTEIK